MCEVIGGAEQRRASLAPQGASCAPQGASFAPQGQRTLAGGRARNERQPPDLHPNVEPPRRGRRKLDCAHSGAPSGAHSHSPRIRGRRSLRSLCPRLLSAAPAGQRHPSPPSFHRRGSKVRTRSGARRGIELFIILARGKICRQDAQSAESISTRHVEQFTSHAKAPS